jgi:Ca-activated chloride channel family protein
MNGPVELLPAVVEDPPDERAGLGTLRTDRGNLPLARLDVRASITGLLAGVELRQAFRNPHDVPLEATYVFPLPDRAAVTGMRMEARDRTIQGVLQERGQAREAYEQALREGKQAAIAEEERPDVFTMRVGNILPRESVTVTLVMVQPLPYADGAATFRFPLVVAPRYIPGAMLLDDQVGDGWAPDTDAVPDASRISPPILLPDFPNPVRLSIEVDVDPAGLPLDRMQSSLHAVRVSGSRLSVRPGERANRDFILRLHYGQTQTATAALALSRDATGDEGTFQLTVLPPDTEGQARRRDVVIALDRSGSMGGWKMVAARRAAARIVDTLTADDRFAVLSFDNVVERPDGLPSGLVAATDRHRYRAVEHLARMEARGGTEMLAALRESVALLRERGRDRTLVLVTDGEIGNEDQVLRALAADLAHIRVHVIGIDRAVNAGFLARLAGAGGGRCELVESEDRLDEAAAHIHRRIAAPLVSELRLVPGGLQIVEGSVAPARLPDLLWGVPLVVTGRWRGTDGAAGEIALAGRGPDREEWTASARATSTGSPALAATWARAHLRDLEDRYAASSAPDQALERRIVETSLRFGVLCRFTAYVAIDPRIATDGRAPHRAIQPVEQPSGWAMPASPAPRLMRSRSAPRATFARPPMPSPMATVSEATPLRRISVAAEAAGEARRLRQAFGDSERLRRVLLADLGSRLAALATSLDSEGGQDAATRLRDLARELEACEGANPPSGADLDRLWERTLTALDELAAGTTRSRLAFWRR